MDRAGKKQVVQNVADKFKQSSAIFLVDYCGLKVAELTQLRRELDQVNSHLQIVKNRLMKRAIDGEKFSALVEHLKGPTAFTFADDAVGAAKVLTKYAEEFEPLKLRIGVMSGEVISLKEIEALSKLPSKEELYAKLLATFMGPITNVVRALNGIPTKVAQVFAAIKVTKE